MSARRETTVVSEGVEETAEAIVAVSVIARETPAHTIPQPASVRLSWLTLVPNKAVEHLFFAGSFSRGKSQVII